MDTIDPHAFRQALGAYPTGVTVVTTMTADGIPVGFTANSFTSVSLNPPMILVCPSRSLSSFQVFQTCDRFAVNILAEGQEEVSNLFSRYGGDRFEKVSWCANPHGMPIIKSVAASFSCRTAQANDAGDHIILLGEVESFEHAGTRGLGYAAGRYFSLGLEQATAQAAPRSRTSWVGAIVHAGNSVLLVESEDGWEVPKTLIERSTAIRTALTDWFAASIFPVTLRRTYSIFDGKNGELFTFFLASSDFASPSSGTFIPLGEIAALRIRSEAERSMLLRFVHETETNSYGFYVGDSVKGYVHAGPANERYGD